MKVFLKIVAWLAGIILVLFLAVEIALSPRVLGSVVDSIAPNFIDGKLEHGAVKADVFGRFPKVRVTLRDVYVTYPAERFAYLDSLYALADDRMYEGKGPDADTLLSFSELSTSINVIELMSGKIRVPYLELENPRAFLKFYDDSTSNLNVFKIEAKKDTVKAPFPKISVDKVIIDGKPRFSCWVAQKDLFMDMGFNSLSIKGKIRTYRWEELRAHLQIDSLLFSAVSGEDTYGLNLKKLDLSAHNRNLNLGMTAKLTSQTKMFGRMDLPLDISADASLPHDSLLVLNLAHFTARLAGIPLSADGHIAFSPGKASIDAKARISDCSLDTLATRVGAAYWSSLSDTYVSTKVNLEATCKGDFIPSEGVKPVLDAKINRLYVDGAGLDLNAKGSLKDLLGGDALFDVDASLDVILDQVAQYIPPELGVKASGDLSVDLKGKFRQSQLDLQHIARTDITASVKSDAFHLDMPLDTLNISMTKLEAALEGSRNKTISELSPKARMLYADINLESVSANLKNKTFITGNGIALAAHSDVAILSFKHPTNVCPLGGRVYANKLSLISGNKTILGIRNSTQDFKVSPKVNNSKIPVLSLTSKNKNVFLKSESNRIRLNQLDLSAKAVLNGIERRTRIIHAMDSLSKLYPTVPRDSLMIYLRRARMSSKETPSWMKEKDFRKYDIKFNMDDKLRKAFMEWDINARVDLSQGFVMTPFYPLRTTVNSLGCEISNNEVRIDSLNIVSGDSDLSLTGDLNGLRRFVFGGGEADLDLDIKSDRINANEILGAIHHGSKMSKEDAAALSTLSDSQYEAAVITDTITVAQPIGSPLIVLPGNIDASVNINAGAIDITNIGISSFATQLAMKQRCLQVTNTVATSDIANLFFEGFYSTQSKEDLTAGFSLSLMDVTAEKVIELVPALDTIVPMLQNLSGLVNLDVAATTDIDTLMNLVVPSLTGVIRIGGKDLAIIDSEQFRKLAKTLMLKNKNSAYVDELNIEGLLADSKLEVFPFIFKMDRYQLAVSGLQNLDSSFKYHASVIRSPLLFKFGLDIAGDFQKSKLTVGKPKYRNAERIPVFSSVIDKARVNLSKSIKSIFHKGVEAAVKENQAQEAIADFKEQNSYVAAVDIQLDSLSNKELYQIDSLTRQSDTINIEDAVIAAY